MRCMQNEGAREPTKCRRASRSPRRHLSLKAASNATGFLEAEPHGPGLPRPAGKGKSMLSGQDAWCGGLIDSGRLEKRLTDRPDLPFSVGRRAQRCLQVIAQVAPSQRKILSQARMNCNVRGSS